MADQSDSKWLLALEIATGQRQGRRYWEEFSAAPKPERTAAEGVIDFQHRVDAEVRAMATQDIAALLERLDT